MHALNEFLISILYNVYPWVKFIPFILGIILFRYLVFNKLAKPQQDLYAIGCSFLTTLLVLLPVGFQFQKFLPDLQKKHAMLEMAVTNKGIVYFPKDTKLKNVPFDEYNVSKVSKKEDGNLILYSCNSLHLKPCIDEILKMP